MEQIEGSVGNDEYRGALATVRFAKNVFLWLIFLALVIQFSGFVLVRFAGAIDVAEPATQPATAPAAGAAENAWEAVYEWALPATKFIALAAGMLLVLTLLLAVKLALVGRTGGVNGFLGAFFWSLLLWVFLIPWQQALAGSTFTCGALYNLGDLLDETARVKAEGAGFFRQVLYYLRFVVYPVFVFLLWLLVHAKFTRGYRRATLGVEQADVSGPEMPAGRM